MKLINKRILHIETFPDTPLIETSCDLALNLKKNNDVNFFWCGYDLPWKDWEINYIKKVLGFSFEKKIQLIHEILKENNVKIIDEIKLNKKKLELISIWANKYNQKKKLNQYFYREKKFRTNLGISVQSSLLSKYKNYSFTNDIELIKNALISSAMIFNRSVQAIRDVKPHAIITFNNRFAISKPIIDAAKLCKVKILRHEVGSSERKYEIFYDDVHNPISRCKTIYKYWKGTSHKTRIQNAKKFFLLPHKKTKKINTGSGKILNWSLNQNDIIKLPKNKKIVTFFTSSNYEYESISNDFSHFAKSKDFLDQQTALGSVTSVLKKLRNYLLIIRVHPSLKNSEFENSFWMKFKSKNIKIIKSESKINSFDLLKKSNYVITYGSTLAIHAAYNNIPSISLRKHFFSCSNVLIEPKNKKELYKVLKRKYYLNNRDKCLPYGNYIMSFGKNFKFYKRHKLFKGYLKNIKVNNYSLFINIVLEIINYSLKIFKLLKKFKYKMFK